MNGKNQTRRYPNISWGPRLHQLKKDAKRKWYEIREGKEELPAYIPLERKYMTSCSSRDFKKTPHITPFWPPRKKKKKRPRQAGTLQRE